MPWGVNTALPTEAARALLDRCKAEHLMLATAESCTGGLIAAALTAIPGSSAVVDRGFVTYSNEAKAELLDVPTDLITRFGAVSAEVARAMVEGALKHSSADLAIAVTGIAGPDGGTPDKPVGLVHIAAARRGGARLHEEKRYGAIGRDEVRMRTVIDALGLLARLLA
jgi:nicotinamide-nucleotide amidase